MKLTVEQIAAMIPDATHVRVNGSLYQIDSVDMEQQGSVYSDPIDDVTWTVSFTELAEDDIVFYNMSEMKVPAALATQEQASEDRDANRDMRGCLDDLIAVWDIEDNSTMNLLGELEKVVERARKTLNKAEKLPTWCSPVGNAIKEL